MKFEVKSYGKSDLAMGIYPDAPSPSAALRRLNREMKVHPVMKTFINKNRPAYTPKQVRVILHELVVP